MVGHSCGNYSLGFRQKITFKVGMFWSKLTPEGLFVFNKLNALEGAFLAKYFESIK